MTGTIEMPEGAGQSPLYKSSFPRFVGQGTGRNVEWICEWRSSAQYPASLAIIEERLRDTHSLTFEELETHRRALQALKDQTLEHISSTHKGRSAAARERADATKAFDRVLRTLAQKERQIRFEQGHLIETTGTQPSTSHKRTRQKKTVIDSPIPAKVPCPSAKSATAKPIEPDILSQGLEERSSVTDLEFSSIWKIVQTAQERLRALAATVPIEKRPEFERLGRESVSLLSTDERDPRSSETKQQQAAAFTAAVEKLEREVIESLQADLGINQAVAQQIFFAGQHGWKDLIIRRADGTIEQNHTIKHLKIVDDPITGSLVADYGLQEIGHGTYKRVKSVQRIGGQRYVRLTSRAKDDELKRGLEKEKGNEQASLELQQFTRWFQRDITSELQARETLVGIPHKTEIVQLHYISKKTGERKTRYIMTKYEGDLWSVSQKIFTQEDQKNALYCCLGVLDCLRALHAAGWVHGDLKTANILFNGLEGYVTDFGFLSRANEPWKYVGVLDYMAPETFFGPSPVVVSPAMDMFSLGILLLQIVAQQRYRQWSFDIGRLQETFGAREKNLALQKAEIQRAREAIALWKKTHPGETADEMEALLQAKQTAFLQLKQQFFDAYKQAYQPLLRVLQKDLTSHPSPFGSLISDLINETPDKRPSCEQAQNRFLIALDKHPLTKGGGSPRSFS